MSEENLQFSFEPFKQEHAELAWVTLLKCASLAEADTVAMLLRSENIPVQIPDEFSAQSLGTPTTVGFVRVQVPPARYQEARETLETEGGGGSE